MFLKKVNQFTVVPIVKQITLITLSLINKYNI